jgi:dolichol-phosphate mannosyltransferase
MQESNVVSDAESQGTQVTLPCKLQSSESAIELAIIVPTFNERDNILLLLISLANVLGRIEWEAVFVDDNSSDGTAEYIRSLAIVDRRIRMLERVGRRGLASACIEGMLATPAPYIAVMDADSQHDETVLPKMIEQIRLERLDIVVASRNLVGGSMGKLPGYRLRLSSLGRRLSRLVCRCDVSDPMSGFFIIDRTYFRRIVHRTSGIGFKILLDLLASGSSAVRVGEVAYRFRERRYGKSKLDVGVELKFLYLLTDKLIGRVIPTRFVLFALVGTFGLSIHIGVLTLLYHWKHESFVLSQAAATFAAMTSNFLLNNLITFREDRLTRWKVLTGLFTFYLACSVGALINLSVATHALDSGIPWILGGALGMAISSVWNYGINSLVTWRRDRA